ncbi:PCRF domain-containing protein, partial [bacterium]|nr:PCRF domain-containing protein [bacterium]
MEFAPAIEKCRSRAASLEQELADPAVYADQRRVSELGRELQRLKTFLGHADGWQTVCREIAENEQFAAGADAELAELARAELTELQAEQTRLETEIRRGLVPADPNDSRNTIVEVRAGAGGEEAALFAA